MKEGDIVLIQYSTKSKAGEYRLGRVVSVEIDTDNLVRTVVVKYCLIQHLTRKERASYKGITVKYIRVAVQRLVLIVPVEEQEDYQGVSEEDKTEANLISSQEVKIDFISNKSSSFIAKRLEQRTVEQGLRSEIYKTNLKEQLKQVEFEGLSNNYEAEDILERPYIFKLKTVV